MISTMDIDKLLRPTILALEPYSSARNEYNGEAMIFLDANESPFNAPYNRYPDPLQRELKQRIAQIKHCHPEQLFLGNGSDEAIDLLFRAFCIPGKDNIVMMDPTYGMYQVAADINQVEVRKVPLDPDFQLSATEMLARANGHTKLMFICSPNNPSGNLAAQQEIELLLQEFKGILVIDEAYIDFAPGASVLRHLEQHPNLVILQTFSKAWGMAGIRLGIALAAPEIIEVFNKIKYPYNINCLTQQKALELIRQENKKEEWVNLILKERNKMEAQLREFSFVSKIYPSDANFLLVKVDDARQLYVWLVREGIIVRDRSRVRQCNNCLRITIGSSVENKELTEQLFRFQQIALDN